MKFLLRVFFLTTCLFFFTHGNILAQGGYCVNGDFEDNSFQNWNGSYSDINDWMDNNRNNRVGSIITTEALDPNPNQAANVQVITNHDMVDPYVPSLSPVYPGDGGNHSLRLGNYYDHSNFNPQNAMSTVTYSFEVPNDNFVFTFHYAVVLEDPNDEHDTLVGPDGTGYIFRPYFAAQMFDQNNDTIDCASYFALADPDLLDDYENVNVDDNPDDFGPQICQANTNGCAQIYYRDWRTISIPLGDYVGQTLTVKFTVSDCKRTGHLGYAYLELDCSTPFVNNYELCGDTPVILEAPEGFFSYQWMGTGIDNEVTRTVEVTESGAYQVTLTSQTETPCPKTFDITVVDSCTRIDETLELCETTTGSGVASEVLLSSFENDLESEYAIDIVGWYEDPDYFNQIDVDVPRDIVNNETYYLSTVNTQAEEGSIYLTININEKPIITFPSINDVCQSEDSVRIPNPEPMGGVFYGDHIRDDGMFQIPGTGNYSFGYTVQNQFGCTDSAQQSINILPNPVLSISGDTSVCFGESATFITDDTTNTASMFVWIDVVESSYYDTTVSPQITIDPITESITLKVYASNPSANCPATSPPHTVNVIRPIIDLEADKDTILFGNPVNLNVVNTNTDSFSWTTNPLNENGIPDNLLNTIQTPEQTTLYTVEGKRFGCPIMDTATVVVLPPISAPYLFSPNGDDENDIWIVKDLLEFPITNVKIFNRWGMLIKELKNGINVWNGLNENNNPVPDGVYYYVVTAQTQNEFLSITGYVTVVH